MKKFLAAYIGTTSALERAGWESMSEKKRREQQKAGMEAWREWVETNQDSIVDIGTPLGKTKRISRQGIADTKNNIVAYNRSGRFP